MSCSAAAGWNKNTGEYTVWGYAEQIAAPRTTVNRGERREAADGDGKMDDAKVVRSSAEKKFPAALPVGDMLKLKLNAEPVERVEQFPGRGERADNGSGDGSAKKSAISCRSNSISFDPAPLALNDEPRRLSA